MAKIITMNIDSPIHRTFSSTLPDLKVSDVMNNLNLSLVFKDSTVLRNEWLTLDFSDAEVGSPCFIKIGNNMYRKTLACTIVELLFSRAYYGLLVKQTSNNPLAQRRLALTLQNLDKAISDIFKENAYVLNLRIAELKLSDESVEYSGNSPLAFLFDNLYAAPMANNYQDLVLYEYTGPDANKGNILIKSALDIAKMKFEPPAFMGITCYKDDSVELDRNMLSFLITNRHLLVSLTSHLYNLNALAEINQVSEYANAGLILQGVLSAMSETEMSDKIHLKESLTSIEDLVEAISGQRFDYHVNPVEQVTILASSDNIKFVVNSLSERDLYLILGHRDVTLRMLEQGLRVELLGEYFVVDKEVGSDFKMFAVYVREIIKIATFIFNGKVKLNKDGFRGNFMNVIMKELRIC